MMLANPGHMISGYFWMICHEKTRPGKRLQKAIENGHRNC